MRFLKSSVDACPQVEKASKGGNEEENSLETGLQNMVSCQLKAVTSVRTVKHEELPIRARQKFRIQVKGTLQR
jgi:hypothetical protein